MLKEKGATCQYEHIKKGRCDDQNISDFACRRGRMAQHDNFIFRPEVEARAPAEQRTHDRAAYRRQIDYLFANSAFHRDKLTAAGFADPQSVGELDDVAK